MGGLEEIRWEWPASRAGNHPVFVGVDLLEFAASHVKERLEGNRLFLLTDDRVERLWGERVRGSLRQAGVDLRTMTIPEGERSKTWEMCRAVLESMVEAGLDRGSCVAALGGGVVGDLAGFAASVFMRGIDFVQFPTTLLAQVDSSLGGKTGVDLPAGKNLAGSFHPAGAVYTDVRFLESLPPLQVRNGMAEVIKYALIRDAELFHRLEREGALLLKRTDAAAWHHLVARCVRMKIEVVTRDRLDRGERMVLNFGHTLGHALEAISGYRVPHGEAVACGMVAASRISRELGRLDAAWIPRIETLIRGCGLPVRFPSWVRPEKVLDALKRDKKAVQGRNRWVLLDAPGSSWVADGVPLPVVRSVVEELAS